VKPALEASVANESDDRTHALPDVQQLETLQWLAVQWCIGGFYDMFGSLLSLQV